jgi:hypothetical protein
MEDGFVGGILKNAKIEPTKQIMVDPNIEF